MSNNLLIPSFLIHVNGSRIAIEDEANVKKIVIFQKIDAPSSFNITFSDIEKKYAESDEISVGSEVKISLGYKDELEELMIGEITGISAHYSRYLGCTTTFTGHDRMHRLNHAYRNQAFNEMTDADIVKKIADDFELETELDDLPVEHAFTMQKNMTDFHYLMQMAERLDCNFLVKDKTLYFKKLLINRAENLVLERGKTLIEFYPRSDTSKTLSEVEVRGWNRNKKEVVVGSALIDDIDSKGGKIVKDNWGDAITIHSDFNIIDEKGADELAMSILKQNARGYVTASGMARGNTDLQAGNIVKINEVGKRYSNKYFIISAKHVLDVEEGYTTEFNAESNIGSTSQASGSDNQEQSTFKEPAKKQDDRAMGTSSGDKAGEAKSSKQEDITNLKWLMDKEEVTKAYVEDNVTISADAKDISDGTKIMISLYEKDYDNEDDFLDRKITRVKNGKISFDWEVEYHEDPDDINSSEEEEEEGYTLPEYIFVLECSKYSIKKESPLLEVYGKIEIQFKSKNKGLVKDKKVKIYKNDGSDFHSSDSNSDGLFKPDDKDFKIGKYFVMLEDDENFI